MKLFEEYPTLSDDTVILDRITEEDIPALEALTTDELVAKTIPTFLYEQKYDDKRLMLARMDEECFLTRQSLLLAVRPQTPERPLIGIAEIYNYEESKKKASVGHRGLRDSRDELQLTDKYVCKRAWLNDPSEPKLPPVSVRQFVMAYEVEQDRLRAMLPEGYSSLRPVLRINAEIRDERTVYLELNTPVAGKDRRGWLNIANWKSTRDEISCSRHGKTTSFQTPFLNISFAETGIEGGCPAERDNDGTFYLGEATEFRPAETIKENKVFCDCEFSWHFSEGDARGKSTGKTMPAYDSPVKNSYPPCALTAENAAAIACRRVLGSYVVCFIRRG